MHIGLFVSGLSGGGAQRRMLNLAQGFIDREHRVDLIVGDADGPFRDQVPAAADVVCLAGGRTSAHSMGSRWSRLPFIRDRRGLWVPALMPALARYLRRQPPDVLLSTSTPANLTALAARAAAGSSLPVVLTANIHLSASTQCRPLIGPVLRRIVASTYPRADAIVAISAGVAADLRQITGIDAHRIAVIDNPVDVASIEHAAAETITHPWLQPDQPPVVLAVAKLKTQKDLPTLLRAFARVRSQRPARLVILGEGEERKRLQALVEQLGLTDAVLMPGFVDNPFAWMARTSVFVLSSAWEGLSNALLEALACGCPVVSTDCPSGPRHVLADGAFGPLVPVGDDRAMAEAILTVLADPPPAERQRARAAAFSSARAVERYLSVLSAVGAGRSGASGTATPLATRLPGR